MAIVGYFLNTLTSQIELNKLNIEFNTSIQYLTLIINIFLTQYN